MKTAQIGARPFVLALSLAVNVHAQNVGIGFSNPQSQLTVNGNLAIGSGFNGAAPTGSTDTVWNPVVACAHFTADKAIGSVIS
jgi:hypothetical protein